MNVAVRPGSVILSKGAESSKSIECINCSLQFTPSSAENEAIQICLSCEKLFDEPRQKVLEDKAAEDANNVSFINLFISIAFVIFAY
jgi:hypothetical protein